MKRSKISKPLILLLLLSTVFSLSGGQKTSKPSSVDNTYSKGIDSLRRENDKKLKLLIDKTLKQYANKKSKATL